MHCGYSDPEEVSDYAINIDRTMECHGFVTAKTNAVNPGAKGTVSSLHYTSQSSYFFPRDRCGRNSLQGVNKA